MFIADQTNFDYNAYDRAYLDAAVAHARTMKMGTTRLIVLWLFRKGA